MCPLLGAVLRAASAFVHLGRLPGLVGARGDGLRRCGSRRDPSTAFASAHSAQDDGRGGECNDCTEREQRLILVGEGMLSRVESNQKQTQIRMKYEQNLGENRAESDRNPNSMAFK